MITENQDEVVELLSLPGTHGGAPVERIETHASIVFLAAERAWKLKRAVRYDYLDYSTRDRRRAMCDAEVRVNRRTAPSLYRRVVPVTRERDGRLMLGGTGEPIDWTIEMARFDQEQLLDRLAERQTLSLELMAPLASAIVNFQSHAEVRRDAGGASAMLAIVNGNAHDFAEHPRVLDPSLCAQVTTRTRDAVQRWSGLLDARRDAGFVRHGHGDLHLRNIVLLDGVPTLFDAVEFSDDISYGDVLYDLAFLLMDLWHRRLPAHANAVWNACLAATADVEGVSLMPLFLSCRAAIRAKTSATASALDHDPSHQLELAEAAGEYLTLAARLLQPSPPCLVAIGGLSGSGKSTLAHTLAPGLGAAPGALVLRSDEIRKRLLGVDAASRLGHEGYTPEVSARVYHRLAECALAAAAGGSAVIADAVFADAGQRSALAEAARAARVRFVGLWLDAPERLRHARVEARTRDVSDADATVVRQQIIQDTDAIDWHHLDAAGSIVDVARRATNVLRRLLPSATV